MADELITGLDNEGLEEEIEENYGTVSYTHLHVYYAGAVPEQIVIPTPSP